MKPMLSLLPTAGMIAATALAVAALSVSPGANAQACKVDSTDGSCANPGKACTAAGGAKGRCKTQQPGVREFVCVCAKSGPTPPRSEIDDPRPRNPREQPQEETEPQEPQPEG